jgi:hypothetical protein
MAIQSPHVAQRRPAHRNRLVPGAVDMWRKQTMGTKTSTGKSYTVPQNSQNLEFN